MYRATRSITALLVLLVALTTVCPGAQSFSVNDKATIAPGGHLVLMNLTVDRTYPEDEAGSIRYLITLDHDSAQDRFDVLLLTADEYLNYASGLPFELVDGISFIDAGAVPAMVYAFFDAPGDYVLIVDNSDRAGVPSASAELMIGYMVFLDNVEVQEESRWDLFIALMALIVVLGAAFLTVLRMAMRHRYQKAMDDMDRKCSRCGKMMADFGEYCPFCGQKR